MANSFTNPNFIRSRPHASAEKQVGDSDPSARTDVVNRVEKGILANLKKLINTIMDGAAFDFTDQTTVAALANQGLTLQAVSGTPAQHGLYRDNVAKAWAFVTLAGGVPTVTESFNVSGITDNGVGSFTIAWDRDFVSATYAVSGSTATNGTAVPCGVTQAAGSFAYYVMDCAGNVQDYSHSLMAIGRQ